MQYQLVMESSHNVMDNVTVEREFDEKIQRLCDEGWKPQGGISVTYWLDKYVVLAQAMVK